MVILIGGLLCSFFPLIISVFVSEETVLDLEASNCRLGRLPKHQLLVNFQLPEPFKLSLDGSFLFGTQVTLEAVDPQRLWDADFNDTFTVQLQQTKNSQ